MADKLSACSVRIELQHLGEKTSSPIILAIGTGFFWKYSQSMFFVTNLHNVTGRHFETQELLDKKNAAIPNNLKGFFYTLDEHGRGIPQAFDQPLYNRDGISTWWEHKDQADVAVFPLGPAKPGIAFSNEEDTDIAINISQDVFVLGYPENISVSGLPIWKRASIASEPEFSAYNSKPTFLIDTSTRRGMSGSPVYAYSTGPYRTKSGAVVVTPEIAKSFVGVYSGRLGEGAFDAQLGIVWKKEIIEEIINQRLNLPKEAK